MSAATVLAAMAEQVKVLKGQLQAHFGLHPAAEIVLSQPGLGPILGARVLGEFGDAEGRYASAKARKNYAATSPLAVVVGARTRGHTQRRARSRPRLASCRSAAW